MGAESKNPGKASFTMLRQGVLSMLFCVPTPGGKDKDDFAICRTLTHPFAKVR
jgi:hypothetical protein